MSISTGFYNRSTQASMGGVPVTQSAHRVIFDATSTFVQSGLILVRPNKPIMLVAYLIPEDAEFIVEGVSVGSRTLRQLGECDYTSASAYLPSAVDIRFREPMDLGGNPWVLTPSTRRLVISLPGTYLLSLNSEEHLSSVHVELVELGDMPVSLPNDYVAGMRPEPSATSASTTEGPSDEVPTTI